MFRWFLENPENSHELCAEGRFPRMAWEKERSAPTGNQNTRIKPNLYVVIYSVQPSVFCVKNKVTYKRARKGCMWLFFVSEAKGKWPTRSHRCNSDPSLFIWSEVSASKLQAFSLCVQEWSVMLPIKSGGHCYNQCAGTSSSVSWAASSQRSIL